jgi:hypothetical protein
VAIRNVRRQSSVPAQSVATPTAAPIYVDSDDNKLKIIPAGSGSTEVEVLQGYAPVVVTANTTLSAATHGYKTVVSNKVDGITFTLPAATGSGVKFKLVVGASLTSSSFVVAVADNTDYFRGRSVVSNDTDGSASNFETANTGTLATESDTMTWNRTTTGLATIGDMVELEDIATDIWSITAHVAASGTEATPFSAAV